MATPTGEVFAAQRSATPGTSRGGPRLRRGEAEPSAEASEPGEEQAGWRQIRGDVRGSPTWPYDVHAYLRCPSVLAPNVVVSFETVAGWGGSTSERPDVGAAVAGQDDEDEHRCRGESRRGDGGCPGSRMRRTVDSGH